MYILKFWKSAGIAVFIIIVSLVPGNQEIKIELLSFYYADKVIHFLMYAVLTSMIIYDLAHHTNLSLYSFPVVLSIALIVVIMSIFTELMQLFFVSGRQGSITDGLANSGGMLFGMIISLLHYK